MNPAIAQSPAPPADHLGRMTGAGAPTAYRESAILTAPPERLVLMLYDGAYRFLTQADAALRAGDVPTCNGRLQRAERIIDELLWTLDMDAGDIAANLQSIYLFCKRKLMDARVARDPDLILTVRGLLAELRDGWAQICGQ